MKDGLRLLDIFFVAAGGIWGLLHFFTESIHFPPTLPDSFKNTNLHHPNG